MKRGAGYWRKWRAWVIRLRKGQNNSQKFSCYSARFPAVRVLAAHTEQTISLWIFSRGVLDLASSENCVAAIQYWDVEKPLNLDSFRDYVGILLFNSPVLSLEKLDELLSCGIPLVLVDNVFPQRKVCSVSIDNEGGVISGLEWLFSQGCRRPAFVESQNGHMRRNEMERRETYRYWMREKGLTPMWMDLVRDKELQSLKSKCRN